MLSPVFTHPRHPENINTYSFFTLKSSRMKRLLQLSLLLPAFIAGQHIYAQGILGKVKDKVKDRANQKTDQAIDKGL